MILASHGIIASQIASASLLLDLYPSAAVAYSLRKLRTLYTGSAIRVRRSSDNAEQDIGFTALGNLDTSSLTSFCGSGNGFVTTWYDLSGNANNAVQTTAANQPQIVSAGAIVTVNTKSAIKFSQTTLPGLLFTELNLTNFTILWVARNKDSGSNYVLLGKSTGVPYAGDGVDNFGSPMMISGSNNIITTGQSNTVNQTGRTAQHLSYLNRRSSTQAVGQFNNSSNAYNNSIPSTTFDTTGISTYGYAYNFQGDIQELIIYSSDKSSDRTGISTDINTYYAIY